MRLTRQGPSLVVHTPAKLNLFLNVLGRREDGFHDLETLMVSVRLYDTIRIESRPASDIELTCRSVCPGSVPLPTGPENLIVKAARLLQQEAGITRGARLELSKRIPIQAGMGGGSSDAAATLAALNRLWAVNLESSRLHELAARLGSDVNFFLDSSVVSACTGRGERTLPVPFSGRWHFVVVKPETGLATATVFREWDARHEGPSLTMNELVSRLQEGGDVAAIRAGLFNALQSSARRLNRELDRLLETLARRNLLSIGMTGSGSACFGLCRSAGQARREARRLRGMGLGRVYSISSGV